MPGKALAWLLACSTALAVGALNAHALSFDEDFSDPARLQSSGTTGLWNTYAGVAQAAAVANGSTARPISFGDGSDGAIDSSTGYTFDTGTTTQRIYQFRSLIIRAGTVTVTGRFPLLIRSLGALTIVPPIDVSGATGTDGTSALQATPLSGGAGGTSRAAVSTGGAGGIAQDTTATDRAGINGVLADGSVYAVPARAQGNVIAGAVAADGQSSPYGPDLDFDTAANFIAGAGGQGGGAYLDALGGTNRAGGAGGGGGGGVIHLTALGPITLGSAPAGATLLSLGGAGGRANAAPNAQCSGSGGGGAGGAVWVQSLDSVTTTTDPLVTGGASGGGIGGCPASTNPAGLDGVLRGDQAAGGTAWSTGDSCGAGLAGCTTANAAPNQTYVLYTRALDLGVFNFRATSTVTLDQTLNGGAISVAYSGSRTGEEFSAFTPDLASVSAQGYRYLQLRVTIQTSGAAAPSPLLSRVRFEYEEAGPSALDFTLGLGCGSTALRSDRHTGSSAPSAPITGVFWFLIGPWIAYRLVRATSEPVSKRLPAAS